MAATGLLVWQFITSATTKGSTIFVNAKGWMSGTRLPLPVYSFQSIIREAIIWACAAVVRPIIPVWRGSFARLTTPAFWVAALWVFAMNRKKIIIWL
jgi:ABC-type polysaccharide/polyol phosphate export permease